MYTSRNEYDKKKMELTPQGSRNFTKFVSMKVVKHFASVHKHFSTPYMQTNNTLIIVHAVTSPAKMCTVRWQKQTAVLAGSVYAISESEDSTTNRSRSSHD